MSAVAVINRNHRRAMRWMAANPGKRPSGHILRALQEANMLEELKIAKEDKAEMERWQAEQQGRSEPTRPPPMPRARRIQPTPHTARFLLTAIAEMEK